MADRLRLAIAQLNLVVGDVDGNAARVIAAACDARDRLRAQAVAFPELTLTGYPPEDLLLRLDLYERVQAALARVAAACVGIDVIVGHPRRVDGQVYNSVSVLRAGARLAGYDKQRLPNYSVFDEHRYFVPGDAPCVVEIHGVPVGLTICEDIWSPAPARAAVDAGAALIVNLNASPYHMEKGSEREAMLGARARECGIPFVYVNLVGGQDELVFDGESFVVDAAGRVTQRFPAFAEGLYAVDIERAGAGLRPVPGEMAPALALEDSVYRALVLGVRDYVDKNGFPGVALGLSGGVDSALTLCIAVDALGADRVQALLMPSRYTAPMSLEDAEAQARALGVAFHVIPIEPMFEVFITALADEFKGRERDATEENLQARIRGTLLMAVSNKTGRMVLTTGNKSETAVGYATLYGDMAGGFGAIKDVFKTLVYRLAAWRNRVEPVIPERVLTRAPSAELRHDQKDTDSLPPYEILDAILERYVEHDRSPAEIVADGYAAATVAHVVALVDRNEYKRRQAAPGVRITRRAFGRDRRYPITSRYRET